MVKLYEYYYLLEKKSINVQIKYTKIVLWLKIPLHIWICFYSNIKKFNFENVSTNTQIHIYAKPKNHSVVLEGNLTSESEFRKIWQISKLARIMKSVEQASRKRTLKYHRSTMSDVHDEEKVKSRECTSMKQKRVLLSRNKYLPSTYSQFKDCLY